MRIIFVGIVDFSYHCLEQVINEGGNIVGIITSKNNGFNSDFRDLSPISKKHGIPIHYCQNVNDEKTLDWIRRKKPDIIFCWGWSQIIKKKLISLPPMGILGVHPALLPQNRGRHPLIWAKVLGLKQSGLTFFFIDEGADSGPILSQAKFRITEEDDALTIYNKIKNLAKIQIADFLPKLILNTFQSKIQDHNQANYWRKRKESDGMIDWRMHPNSILNLIQALTRPYPGALFFHKNMKIHVWKAHVFPELVPENIEPGKIIKLENEKPIIKCSGGAIVLDELDPDIEFQKGDYIS